ncbi:MULTISPECIES: acetolactate decarboxylase [unclassified Methanoregula]|uniref:acetolactate decarboxylase n=1 Tax=unclassified Methanoregula TaxID=2649730 RepID=UPI0009CC6291|nr:MULTISPECIES: acetolactate decarboxylase [unclassified Methanoregula]OPX61743.1 MAG: Alpha-acetolactate decarboxylase [Methanoregula sp. PtaB.Bin085]OPY33948.1 MAG: Alpha-acetolactate decarboxylase [Methanoregula sp. PtaU1.Bin006]
MDTKFFLGIVLAIVVVFAGAAVYSGLTKNQTAVAAPAAGDRDVLYQVSTIDALMQGVFDGIRPVKEIRRQGDFGIGTFDALDGEMIVLDGVVYQAKADGRIYPADDRMTTPFATVTFFDQDRTEVTEQPMNLSEFSSAMERRLPTGNMIYAVRMHGTFPSVKVRAIPAQHKPFPTLAEASKNQSVYTYTNSTGTVVGFFTPVFFRGVNVAGYHLHFISDDKKTGGHILDITIPAHTTVVYDITPGFAMALPTSGDFTGVDLSKDLTGDLAQIEK